MAVTPRTTIIKLSELRALSCEEQEKALKSLIASAGKLTTDDLKRKIADFEKFYGMSSEEMQKSVHSGTMKKDATIAYWCQTLDLLYVANAS